MNKLNEALASTAAPRFDLVKDGANVLWVYFDRFAKKPMVETGTVIEIRDGVACLLWLDGYKSRNDDVKLDELIAVWDPDGPRLDIFPFYGCGHVLPAGDEWIRNNPNPAR